MSSIEFASHHSDAKLPGLFQVFILHKRRSPALRDRRHRVRPQRSGRPEVPDRRRDRLPGAVPLRPARAHGLGQELCTNEQRGRRPPPGAQDRDDHSRRSAGSPSRHQMIKILRLSCDHQVVEASTTRFISPRGYLAFAAWDPQPASDPGQQPGHQPRQRQSSPYTGTGKAHRVDRDQGEPGGHPSTQVGEKGTTRER